MVTDNITSIGVFYDGSYFSYINSSFKSKGFINMLGFNQFIKDKVSVLEGVDIRFCNIVEAHYFRGRLTAKHCDDRGILYPERVFDEVLMRANITTHYLPIKESNGIMEEKGVDVWLALEALEQSFYKRFSVLVLVASDGDFVPLIRKLNSLGVKVLLIYWDNLETGTRSSKQLITEATYSVDINAELQDRKNGDSLAAKIFKGV